MLFFTTNVYIFYFYIYIFIYLLFPKSEPGQLQKNYTTALENHKGCHLRNGDDEECDSLATFLSSQRKLTNDINFILSAFSFTHTWVILRTFILLLLSFYNNNGFCQGLILLVLKVSFGETLAHTRIVGSFFVVELRSDFKLFILQAFFGIFLPDLFQILLKLLFSIIVAPLFAATAATHNPIQKRHNKKAQHY